MPPRKKIRTGKSANDKISTAANAAHITDLVAPSAVAHPLAPRRNVRGRRGGLQNMPDMPLDILCEIMSVLHPRDLLNLARTSKTFRAFLMSRNQALLWKASRSQVPDLPPLPSFLSEPAYANLAFFSHCHSCLKPNVQRAYYAFGARYCTDGCGQNLLLYKQDPVKAVSNEVKAISCGNEPVMFVNVAPSRARRRPVVHKVQFDAFCRRWSELTDQEDKKRFIRDCREDAQKRQEFAYNLEVWVQNQIAERIQELDDLRGERQAAVKQRLQQEGWDKELTYMENTRAICLLYELPSVCRPSKLTDGGWKKIKAGVIALMGTYRDKRIKQDRRDLLAARLQQLREALAEHLSALKGSGQPRTRADDVVPTAGDLAYLPAFRRLVEADSGIVVTKSSFAPLLESWPALVAEWTEQRQAEFRDQALSFLKGSPAADAEDVLQLAVATFHCWLCMSPSRLRWPDLLGHPCCRTSFADFWLQNKSEYDEVVHKVCQFEVFHGLTALRPNKCLEEMRGVIRACGADPDVVTFAAMQESPVRLRCKLCMQLDQYQIFDWTSAVDHQNVVHWPKESPTGTDLWEPVPQDRAAQATALAEAICTANSMDGDYTRSVAHYIACAWCSSYRTRNGEDIVVHLGREHGKHEPVNGVDLYVTEGSRVLEGLPPIWVFSAALSDTPMAKEFVDLGRGFFVSTMDTLGAADPAVLEGARD